MCGQGVGASYWLANSSALRYACQNPDTLVPMSPNRRDLEPSRQAERERLRRRGVLIRDVGLAIIFALVLFGLWKFVLG
jgi:hypothetical protein